MSISINTSISEECAIVETIIKESNQQRLSTESEIKSVVPIPYKNQVIASNEIFTIFTMLCIRYVLLRANEQSGKAGTYHTLITQMFEANLIDQTYILCGSHDIGLMQQCVKDREEWHKDKHYRNNIHIIFRQKFDRTNMIKKRTLIIVDESHLVESVDQTLSKFLERHGLSMAGTRSDMITNNTYIVSVDATPYAEESAMVYGPTLSKSKVILKDGDGYFGVKEYYEKGFVHSTITDLYNEENYADLEALINIVPGKFILARFSHNSKDKEIFEQCARECGCDILYFTSEFSKSTTQICITEKEADEHFAKYKVRIPCLEVAPERTTVVLICGRLRCGERVPKKHIGFVWEGSVNPNTDVVRQSLYGRMCGYLGTGLYNVPEANTDKPHIFIPKRTLDRPENKKVVQLSDLERTIYPNPSDAAIIGPRFANNIIPGRVLNQAMKSGRPLSACVPIRFMLDSEQIGDLNPATPADTIKSYCLNKLIEKSIRLIENNQTLTPEQKVEIQIRLDTITAERTNYRYYRDESNRSMHKRHVEAYEAHVASAEHISDFNFLTFCVVFPGFRQLESVLKPSVPGEVYAIFYTEARGYDHVIDKESRISKVNDKTHFTIQPINEVLGSPGVSVYGFDPKIMIESEQFKIQLDYFIRIAKENIGIFGKRFTALYNGECIELPRHLYGDNLETLKGIIQRLEREHSVKIKYEVKKKKFLSDTIGLKFIEWI